MYVLEFGGVEDRVGGAVCKNKRHNMNHRTTAQSLDWFLIEECSSPMI